MDQSVVVVVSIVDVFIVVVMPTVDSVVEISSNGAGVSSVVGNVVKNICMISVVSGVSDDVSIDVDTVNPIVSAVDVDSVISVVLCVDSVWSVSYGVVMIVPAVEAVSGNEVVLPIKTDVVSVARGRLHVVVGNVVKNVVWKSVVWKSVVSGCSGTSGDVINDVIVVGDVAIGDVAVVYALVVVPVYSILLNV